MWYEVAKAEYMQQNLKKKTQITHAVGTEQKRHGSYA
jgi:hypothetical protein